MAAANYKPKFTSHTGNNQWMAKVPVGFVHDFPDLIHRKFQVLR
jgi:hypothetical protein